MAPLGKKTANDSLTSSYYPQHTPLQIFLHGWRRKKGLGTHEWRTSTLYDMKEEGKRKSFRPCDLMLWDLCVCLPTSCYSHSCVPSWDRCLWQKRKGKEEKKKMRQTLPSYSFLLYKRNSQPVPSVLCVVCELHLQWPLSCMSLRQAGTLFVYEGHSAAWQAMPSLFSSMWRAFMLKPTACGLPAPYRSLSPTRAWGPGVFSMATMCTTPPHPSLLLLFYSLSVILPIPCVRLPGMRVSPEQ